jgi:hypothetical protein
MKAPAYIKARGETDFSVAGDGVVLRYRNSDLKRIEEAVGPQWFNELLDKSLNGLVTMDMLELYLSAGAKKNGEPYEIPAEVLDNIVVNDVFELILESVCISKTGKSAEEYVKEIFEALEEAKRDGTVPLLEIPDTLNSTTSDESVSGPASE